MRLSSMFSGPCPPVAVDFGASAIKLLQVSGGAPPDLMAAAAIPVPDEVRQDPSLFMDFCSREIPRAMREGRFKGNRVVCAVPSQQTHVQHIQVAGGDDAARQTAVRSELQLRTGCSPDQVVMRTINVTDVHVDGQTRREMICLAISREMVMRYVSMFNRCKLEAVGIHTEILAMMRCFEHLNRRAADEHVTTMYVDLGYAGMRIAIGHGKALVFARYVGIGGRTFDQHAMAELGCDAASARQYRLALDEDGRPRPVERQPTAAATTAVLAAPREIAARVHEAGPAAAAEPEPDVEVDFTGPLEMVVDELSMCARYYESIFPQRRVSRVVLLGGEARQPWLCHRIAAGLHAPAQLADPLRRFRNQAAIETPGLECEQPQPGWAVVSGLCNAPTDL